MIGVLVSGEGTNLQALLDAGLPVVAVASNDAGARALERADAAGVASATFALDDYADRDARDAAMADWLVEQGVELVVCAGYMHLLRPAFLDRFPQRVVNVHPAPLPDFPGPHPLEDVLAAGAPAAAATVHYVDEGVDTGEVIASRGRSRPRRRHRGVAARARARRRASAPSEGGARAVRALISVYDKTGVVDFARGLAELGFELVSSGGTASTLEEAGLSVTTVEDVTGFPEMLGGRVKTLHPRVHAGILARREQEEDLATLAEHGIELFDLVCVNLYPFELAVDRPELDEAELVELIDVGGPAMLRAAAKSFESVVAVCRPQDYDAVLSELWAEQGSSTPELRRRLAAVAFARTAAYDSAIARWFQRGDAFPETFVPSFDRVLELAYGENPHQSAAYYSERGARTHLLSFVEQLQGKHLSFNNLNDLSAARLLAVELDGPACVIVKHANPCGVGVAETIEEAYAKALAADPVSAFGGVVVLNRAVGEALAGALAEQFVEVLFAPAFDARARDVLARKESLRVLEHTEQRAVDEAERDYRRVIGGLLVQQRDVGFISRGRARRRVRRGRGGPVGGSPVRVARRQARDVERDRSRARRPDARDRRRADEPRRRRPDRDREGAGARSHARGRRSRVGCVLPVRGRAAARARRRRRGVHPARRLEARRRGDRRGPISGRGDGLHRPASLPALTQSLRMVSPGRTTPGVHDADVHAAEAQGAPVLRVDEPDRGRAEALRELRASRMRHLGDLGDGRPDLASRVPIGRFSGRRSRST